MNLTLQGDRLAQEWSLSKAEVEHYWREGWVVVEGLLGAADLAELDQVIAEIVDAARAGGEASSHVEQEPADTRERPSIRRVINPYERHAAFRAVVHDPRVADRAESLLGPDVELHHSKLNWKPARFGSPVKWHQDLGFYPHTNDSVLAVLIYLDDATEANGCVQVLSRQHHQYRNHSTLATGFAGQFTEQNGADIAPLALTAPAGSAIFLHGLTPHSSLPNTSNTDRRTLIYALRAGDAYPLYYGTVTVEDESGTHQIRGQRARHARFGGPSPIVPRLNGASSLYEIQAAYDATLPAEPNPSG